MAGNYAERTSGMVLIALSGALITMNAVASRILKGMGWPYFRFMGTASACIALSIFSGLLYTQGVAGVCCERRQIKWVLARGMCGTLQFLFNVLAVLTGAGVGDIGALTSLNTVVAALLGRLFLGEKLGVAHVAAMSMSILGAVLISRPWSTDENPAWLGYFFAILSAAALGGMFVCARKAGATSTWLLTVSAMGQRGLVFWAVPLIGLVPDNSMDKVKATPGVAVGILLLLMLTTFSGNFLATQGAKTCRAAVSATVMTAVNMGVGYAAQVLIFDDSPSAVALGGAALMLIAVVGMALARVPAKKKEVSQEKLEMPPGKTFPDLVSETTTESLATFVASEYAEREMHNEEDARHVSLDTPTVRYRSTTAGGTGAGAMNTLAPAAELHGAAVSETA